MRRILLVDDSPADAELFREALSEGEPQAELHVVVDGKAALDFLNRRGAHVTAQRPDVIVLDLNLPGLDGFDVLNALQNDADPDLRRVPVVVFTTSRAPEDVQRAYDLHASSFVTKPSDFREYLRAVSALRAWWLQVSTLPTS